MVFREGVGEGLGDGVAETVTDSDADSVGMDATHYSTTIFCTWAVTNVRQHMRNAVVAKISCKLH